VEKKAAKKNIALQKKRFFGFRKKKNCSIGGKSDFERL